MELSSYLQGLQTEPRHLVDFSAIPEAELFARYCFPPLLEAKPNRRSSMQYHQTLTNVGLPGYFNIPNDKRNYWYAISVYERYETTGERVLVLDPYIEAPGRGDLIVAEVDNVAQLVANLNGCRVKQVIEPTNSKAYRCYDRNGYLSLGRGFVREYQPILVI